MKKITIDISDDAHIRATKLARRQQVLRPALYAKCFIAGLTFLEKEQEIYETKNQEK